MWDMAKHSIILFFRGRLFQDIGNVFRQIVLGALFTAVVFLAVMAGLAWMAIDLKAGNAWIASAVAGLLGGMLQPYLFKDLKYA